MKLSKTMLLLSLTAGLSACVGLPDQSTTRYQYDDISDSDHDGVINARDICHSSPDNVAVDNTGCTSWDVSEHIDKVSIDFGFDKDKIPSKFFKDLNRQADILLTNEDFYVTIIGDTSPEGSIEYNEALARRRAEAVVQLFVSRGVPKKRISVHYFTDQLPIVTDFLSKREHRIVTLTHSPVYTHQPKWNIFTSENKLKR